MQIYSALSEAGIKPRLASLWNEALADQGQAAGDFCTKQQQAIFALARSYKDILHSDCPYPARYDLCRRTLNLAKLRVQYSPLDQCSDQATIPFTTAYYSSSRRPSKTKKWLLEHSFVLQSR